MKKTIPDSLELFSSLRIHAESLFLDAVFMLGDGIVLTDSDLNILVLNKDAEALYETTLLECIGRSAQEHFGWILPNQEEKTPSPFARNPQTHRTITGKKLHVLLSMLPVQEADGSVQSFLFLIRDRTSLALALEQLSENRNNRCIQLAG